MPTHTMASTTTCPINSRSRSDQARPMLLGRLEYVAGAAQRMDHGVAPVVDFLAQIRDVQLDDVGPAAEVVTPHPVQDLRLAQYAFGVAHHESQELKLGGRQRDRLAGTGHLVALLGEHPVADDEL